MSACEPKYQLLWTLVLKSLSDSLSPDELQLFQNMMAQEAELRSYYLDCIRVHTGLSKVVGEMVFASTGEIETLNAALLTLRDHERNAVTIHSPAEENASGNELIRRIERPHVKYVHLKKSSIITFLITSAAVLTLVMLGRFAPLKSGIEVATLSDSLNAKWTEGDALLSNGKRLATGSHDYCLREGYAKVEFDNNTIVTLEGPAEFQILTGDQVKLNYGKLFAIVPPQAYGFVVSTPFAKIIDLGTEFGVRQGVNESTELHVIKGKTNFVSGFRGARINDLVEAGSARQMDGLSGEFQTIPCEEWLFVRRIDSQNRIVWRGVDPLFRDTAADESKKIVFSDNFEEGHRNQWHLIRAGELKVQDDSGRLGSGKAMFWDAHLPTFYPSILANFEAVELQNEGDSISLRLDFRLADWDRQKGDVFRLGLFDSNGTIQMVDAVGDRSTASAADDQGFFAMQPLASGEEVVLCEELGQTSSFMGGDDVKRLRIDKNPGGLDEVLNHTIVFSITRKNKELMLEYWCDEDKYLSGIVQTDQFRFNQVGLSGVCSKGTFVIDNVVVNFTSRPGFPDTKRSPTRE